jgi:glycosyltransferase involved in cell wall biosynthesis
LESIPQLILVGRDDLDLSQSSEGFGELIKTKKIVILQGLSDSDLFELYKACLFTVFPSVSEGYGLPVAESLSLGKLCIASDLPTIRDHAGNLPWYFDPTDEDAILAELRRAIVQPEERRAAEQRILADFRASTWSSTFNVIATAVASTRQTSNSGGLHSADKSPC